MRTGVWLVGARGSVAVTSIVGALALRAGLAPADRLRHRAARSCAARPCRPWPTWSSAATTSPPRRWCKKAEALGRRRRAARPAGRGASPTSWPRSRRSCGPRRPARTQAATGRRASPPTSPASASGTAWTGWWWSTSSTTEPAPPPHPAHADLDRAARPRCAEPGRCCRPAPSYAYAAFTAGCSYVDFTPSTGARLPALAELGRASRPAVRRARRQDRRDAGQVGARADVRACATCAVRSPGRASTCSAAATAPTSPTRPPTPPRSASKQRVLARDARLRAAGPHPHRVRRRHRRLQDRLGPDHLQRLPRHAGCGWSSPGTAATPRWPRRWCSTWPGSPPPRTPPGAPAR